MEKTEARGKVNKADCIFEVDFYNSSDTPKSLRETYVEMVQRKTNETYRLAIVLPLPAGTISYSGLPNVMKIVNFPPKEMFHLKLNSYFQPEEKINVEGKVEFYFRGKYPNGKKFRKKLSNVDF